MVHLILPSEGLTAVTYSTFWGHTDKGNPIKQGHVTRCPQDLTRATVGRCLNAVGPKDVLILASFWWDLPVVKSETLICIKSN